MNANRSKNSGNDHNFVPDIPAVAPELQTELHSAENTMDEAATLLREKVIHSADRSETQHRVLVFLAHAQGPTATGLARQLQLPFKRATTALASLEAAGLVWRQPPAGPRGGWHLSLEGRHYLDRRNLLPNNHST